MSGISSLVTKNKISIQFNVAVTGIQINEGIKSLEVGETNYYNNSWQCYRQKCYMEIKWWTAVNEVGKVVAKRYGTVDIVATSSKRKTSTIKNI